MKQPARSWGTAMRLKAFLVMILTATGLVVAGQTAPAYAATCAKVLGTGSVRAFEPYAATGYGPVTHGIEVDTSGLARARAGFYSPITTEFAPTTEWLGLAELSAWVGYSNSSDNGGSYLTCVWGLLETPHGPIGYGSQYREVSKGVVEHQVRWGSYNFDTKLFHPDGGVWQPMVA